MGSAERELERRSDVPLPTAAHRERRAEELRWVKTNGQAASLLAARADVQAARAAGVTVGPAMGSTHASLLLWCMGVTEFDPVAWHLPPSTFYKTEPRARQARWYVSARSLQSDRFQFDPLVAALASARSAAHGIQAPTTKPAGPHKVAVGGPWSFTSYPDAAWILAHDTAPTFNDRVCAHALARPGPAGCGMLRAWLSRGTQLRGTWLPDILGISRGALVFREQLHAIGGELLGLDMPGAARFARDHTVGRHHRWRARLRTALAAIGASQRQSDDLLTDIVRWTPFLATLAHELGRVRLLARCAQRGIPIEVA